MKARPFLFILLLVFTTTFLSGQFTASAQSASVESDSTSRTIALAVETGDIATVKSLLLAKPSLIVTRVPGADDPLIVWAARKKQPAVVALLLESGADIQATNNLGSNTLHLAAFTGDYDLMELLLNSGVDPTLRNKRGKIPIDYVSFGKNPRVFELFLEKDKNCLQERTSDGATLMHMATSAADTAGLSFLLARGLDINARDNRGATVVHYAMDCRELPVIDYLRRHGADLDAPENLGFTPLFHAVLLQSSEYTLYLTRYGANVNHATREGYTPLMLAARQDNIAMTELLLSKGADPLAVSKEGKSALHEAVMNGSLPVVNLLMANTKLLNIRDKEGMTPLHYAAAYGYTSIGIALIEKGADPAITDNKNHDPFYYCEWYGNLKLGQYLQQKMGTQPLKHDPVSPVAGNLAGGEAVIHYLNHSGYAVETEKHLLIFDYFQPNPEPSKPSLLNGRINPQELKGKKIIVFASHEHGDHYDTTIWGWRKGNPDISYIMGFRPETGQRYEFIAPHEQKTINGVTINAIRSTDSGAGFLVETDGIVVYHPGDHVNKVKDLGPEFTEEIDYLVSLNKKVDIAFFPVSGCGFPDLEAVKRGNYYVIGKMKPALCFTMHGENKACAAMSGDISKTFDNQASAYGTFPGDRFYYPQR
jgi:ankyrin repeat protein